MVAIPSYGVWCMVYGDLRKSGINDEYLMRVEDSGKIYTNAGVKMGTSGYCDNDVLKKYIDNKVTAPSAVLPNLGLTSSLSPMVNLKDGIKVSLPSSEQTTTEATEISCPDGQVEKNGKCVETQVCIAGQIWNPIASKCEACTSNVEWINYANESRMYCPGVMDKKLPVLQQLKKCPKGAWPNTGLTGCDCRWGTKDGDTCKNMNISASDLQYGPKGKSAPLVEQCWTKSTPATYKKCMGFDD